MNDFFSKFVSVGSIKVTGMVLSLLLTVILSRVITPNDVGEYYLLISVANFLAIFLSFGGHVGLVKHVSRIGRYAALNEIISLLGSRLTACLITYFTAILLLSIAHYVFEYQFVTWLWLSLVISPLIIIQHYNTELHRSYLHFIRSALSQNAIALLLLVIGVCVVGMLSIDASLKIVVAIYGIGLALAVLFNPTKFGKKSIGGYKHEFSHYANTLWINQLAGLLLVYLHLWIVGYFLPMHDVAIFEISYKLSLLASFSLMISSSIAIPYLSKYELDNDISIIQTVVNKTFVLQFLPCLALVVLAILFGEFAISILYGDEYSDIYPILVILLFSQLISVLCGLGGVILNMTGYHTHLKTITIRTLIVSVLISLLLTLNFGLYGAAIASMISVAILNLGAIYKVKKLLGVSCIPLNYIWNKLCCYR